MDKVRNLFHSPQEIQPIGIIVVDVASSVHVPQDERFEALVVVDELLVCQLHEVELEDSRLIVLWKRSSGW